MVLGVVGTNGLWEGSLVINPDPDYALQNEDLLLVMTKKQYNSKNVFYWNSPLEDKSKGGPVGKAKEQQKLERVESISQKQEPGDFEILTRTQQRLVH